MKNPYNKYPVIVYECQENNKVQLRAVFLGLPDKQIYHDVNNEEEVSVILKSLLSKYDTPPLPVNTLNIDPDEIANDRGITNIISSKQILVQY